MSSKSLSCLHERVHCKRESSDIAVIIVTKNSKKGDFLHKTILIIRWNSQSVISCVIVHDHDHDHFIHHDHIRHSDRQVEQSERDQLDGRVARMEESIERLL